MPNIPVWLPEDQWADVVSAMRAISNMVEGKWRDILIHRARSIEEQVRKRAEKKP